MTKEKKKSTDPLNDKLLERYQGEEPADHSPARIRQMEVNAIMAKVEETSLPNSLKSELQYHYLRFLKHNKD